MSLQDYLEFYWSGGDELRADDLFDWIEEMGNCDCGHRALVWADDNAETRWRAHCEKCSWSPESFAPQEMTIAAAKLHHRDTHEKRRQPHRSGRPS